MQSQQTSSINTPADSTITKGDYSLHPLISFLTYISRRNFTQFYSTKSERERNLRKEYDTQMEYRKHLQAFIDRWRYNANRAAQAQSKIKILEKVLFPLLLLEFSLFNELNRYLYYCQLPELTPPEAEDHETFRFPETEKISPPLLQLSEVTFGYDSIRPPVLNKVSIDVGLDSRIAVIGSNGAGKSTL